MSKKVEKAISIVDHYKHYIKYLSKFDNEYQLNALDKLIENKLIGKMDYKRILKVLQENK